MKSFIPIILFLLTAGSAMAQTSDYILLDKSTMQIEGTSTLHDWTCDVQELNSSIDFDASALEMETKSSPVQTLVLNIPVDKIESGKGGMNKKIYGALKEKKHPTISFELKNSELAPEGTNGNEAHFQLVASGMLTIAGTSQEISFPVDGYVQDDGTYKFTGNYEINMKDYNVDPPSAMLGTIKSGEIVTVSFEFFISKG